MKGKETMTNVEALTNAIYLIINMDYGKTDEGSQTADVLIALRNELSKKVYKTVGRDGRPKMVTIPENEKENQ
jgi:hypothetical protein